MTRVFQVGAWLCLAAIGVLSLVAPSLRPVTFLPHNAEHFAIFTLAGLAIKLGYPNRTTQHMAGLTCGLRACAAASSFGLWPFSLWHAALAFSFV
jgi:hypothetical protein